MLKIYVATSWRNEAHETVVRSLRLAGHEVYNFREHEGFHWNQIDPGWREWRRNDFREHLDHNELVRVGYQRDRTALNWADVVLMLQPCGNSSHMELGWAAGRGKHTIILLAHGEPELMYKMADWVCVDLLGVMVYLEEIEKQ